MLESSEDDISFFEAFFGLALSPASTTRILLTTDHPRYGIRFLLFLCIVLALPFAMYYRINSHFPPNAEHSIIAFAVLVGLTIILSSLTVCIFSIIFNIGISTSHIFSCLAYATAPLTLSLILIFGSDYATHRSFSIVQLVCYGDTTLNTLFSDALPFALAICYILSFLTLALGLRVVASASLIGGALSGLFFTIIVSLSFLSASLVAERLDKGITASLFRLVTDRQATRINTLRNYDVFKNSEK